MPRAKRLPTKCRSYPAERTTEVQPETRSELNTWRFDVTQHDAYVEITSPYTNRTALLRIERQPEDTTFWPSYRLVWLFTKTDPNNPRHWRAFGTVDDFGVKIFGTCQSKDGERTIWEKLGGMLERAAYFETVKGCRYKFTLIQD